MKTCRTCNIKFVPRKWQLENSDYECLSCKRFRQNKFNENDPMFLKKHRDNYKKRKSWYSNYQKQLRKTLSGKLKIWSRRQLRYAIETGKIVKPPKCSKCLYEKRLDAHHSKGYKNPLLVVWLCRRCHIDLHRKHKLADAMIAERGRDELR